jgi:DhnA family fructose-bisphosphate aldolase class Ia
LSGRAIRTSRLFDPTSGRAVIVPVDHGTVLGSIAGLTDPLEVLARLVELKVDGTLLGMGLGKLAARLFERRDAPARVLTADHPLLGSVPGRDDGASHNVLLATPEFALRHGYDCLKAILLFGLEREAQLANVRLVGSLAEECDRCGLPLMVEPVLWGGAIGPEQKNDPQLVEHASRMALESGADLLKIPYTGDVEQFRSLVRRLAVPVLVLGGPKMGTLREVLQVALDSVRAGARGVVFGRNVWQHPRMDALVGALQDVVHRQEEPDAALARHGLLEGVAADA